MIKFKEKNFFIGAAIGALGVGMTGAQIFQASGQAKEAEAQSAEQVKAINAQTAAINNLAKKNPAAGQAFAEAKSQQQYSDSETKSIMSNLKTRMFAANPGFISKTWDAAKNLYKANPKFAEQAKLGLGIGVTAGAGRYIVGKVINNDAKKNGIDLQAATNLNKQQAAGPQQQYGMQRTYSVLDRRNFTAAPVQQGAQQGSEQAAQKVGGSIFSKLKKHAGGQLLNVGFAGMEGMSSWGAYKAEKDALLSMQNQSAGQQDQRQRQQYPQRPMQTMHSESIMQKQFGFGTFAARAGKKFMNFAGGMLGGGNSKTISQAGKKLVNTAGDNNIQKGLGEFMTNHKWAATATALPVGMLAFSGGEKIGSAAIKAPTKAMDKDAYNWENYQNSKVQQ